MSASGLAFNTIPQTYYLQAGNIVSKIGRAEVATDPVGVDAADIFVALTPRDEWTSAGSREELIEKMSEALERGAPEGAFSFSQPIEMRISELISGVRSDIAVKLFGDDLETLRRTATRIAQVVGRISGAEDVRISGSNARHRPPDTAVPQKRA